MAQNCNSSYEFGSTEYISVVLISGQTQVTLFNLEKCFHVYTILKSERYQYARPFQCRLKKWRYRIFFEDGTKVKTPFEIKPPL